MTWREWMETYLTERGLWPKEAQAVIADHTAKDAPGEPMATRLDDEMEGYPSQLKAVVLIGLNAEAVHGIDAHAPRHFALSIFT